MTDIDQAPIHLSPVGDAHRELGARLIEFGGWLMPVQYSSIIEEHRAVRERVGLFDLSHMGELYVEGPEAGAALASALVSDPPRLAIGRAHYSMICAADGGIIDDLIVYRLAEARFLVVANAGNAAIVSDALAERLKGFKAVLDDRLAGDRPPRRPGPPRRRGPRPADGCRPGRPALLRGRRGFGGGRSRPDRADGLHRRGRLRDLRRHGRDRWAVGGPPRCGAGARRSAGRVGCPRHAPARGRDAALRQRARSHHEPYEAGLGRVVKLDKPGEFVGRAALEKVARDGPARRLVGLIVEGRGSPGTGIPVWSGERRTGIVTSGTQSPTLGVPIAMAYVAPADAEPGTVVDVEIRDARVPARVVALPFYRREA